MATTLDLTGKTAFVTGSTRGIGHAVAVALYQAGARVAIVGRDAGKAGAVAAELGERAFGVACDVSDGKQIESAIAAAEQALGPVDVLVNNAGITRDNLLLRMTEAEWDEVLAANLKGAFLTTKAVLKGMMKRRSGRIINVTSIVGLTGNKGQANYAASKAGRPDRLHQVGRERVWQPGNSGQRDRPGIYRDRHDERPAGRSPEGDARGHYAGTAGTAGRRGGGGPLSGLRPGGLHYRTSARGRRRLRRLTGTPFHLPLPRNVMSNVEDRVKDIIVEELGVEREKLTPEASFMEDLGADSLDTVELVMAFEKEFDIDIPDEEAEKLRTVGDALKYLHEKLGK